MNDPFVSLLFYSLAIVAGALAGGAVPMFTDVRGRRMEMLLAFSAGVMLGVAFFQMLPEALHDSGASILPTVLAGIVALFLIERFAAAHVCGEPEECEVHGTMGISAFLGMSAHTLFDGVALGSSVTAGLGGLVFFAVVAHKIPSSLALATVLVHARYARARVALMVALFALMVPFGAGVYFLVRDLVDVEQFGAHALAFSAGTFLYLALADLLPQVHHASSHKRLGTIASLLAGIGAMWALTLFGGHGH